MVKRANRRLFALRSLRRCGVPASDIILVHKSLVRSFLENACVVFSNLPLYLSDAIEKSVKPLPSKNFSYVIINWSLDSNLQSLQDRMIIECERFITSLKPSNPVYKLVNSLIVDTQYNYASRPRERNSNIHLSQTNTLYALHMTSFPLFCLYILVGC